MVVFNGAEYVIKASNVDPKHYETLTNLHNEEIFQDSVATATPKYVTVNNDLSAKVPLAKSSSHSPSLFVYPGLFNLYNS